MTLDDDSFLSAYMDGQLNPDQQQWVESALVADPQLAENLRRLTILRDLLASWPCDASVDVTAPVLNRIRRRLRLRALLAESLHPSTAPLRWARAAGLTVAAGLLIALTLTLTPWPPRRAPDRSAGAPLPSTASHVGFPKVPQPEAPEAQQPSSASRVLEAGASGERESGDRPAGQTPPAAEVRVAAGELEDVRQYLDNPHLRHCFLVSDPDGTAQRKVASVVEQTTRFNYYKITISQGIVIDPRHPDQATVFALVVNSRELENLRLQLRTALKDQVEEPPVDPTIVTQLADIGQVQACPPALLADMMIPRDRDLAIKQPAGAENPPEPERNTPAAAELALLNRGVMAGAGPSKPADPPAAGPIRPPDLVTEKDDRRGPRGLPGPADEPDQRVVVLVWVAQTRSG
jgi:anti-sigma factor RsiW